MSHTTHPLAELPDLPIAGRGKLSCSADVSPCGVRLRIDDDANPSFWAEIRLTPAVLDLLAAAVREWRAQGLQPADEAAVRDLLGRRGK